MGYVMSIFFPFLAERNSVRRVMFMRVCTTTLGKESPDN